MSTPTGAEHAETATPPPYDAWFSETPRTAPETWTFEGRAGLERLGGPTSMSAPDPDGFRARLVRVQLDHVALESLALGPHRSERDAAHVADSSRATFTFVLVAEGTVRVESRLASFDVPAGQCVLLDSRTPVTVSADGDVRMLRSVVGAHHIPIGLRHTGVPLTGPYLARRSSTPSSRSSRTSCEQRSAAEQ
jgi:hypothetical protein